MLLRRGVDYEDLLFHEGDTIMPIEEQYDQVFEFNEQDSDHEESSTREMTSPIVTKNTKDMTSPLVNFNDTVLEIPTGIENNTAIQAVPLVTAARKKEIFYPVEDVNVKDVSGAGDTFMSGLVTEMVRAKNISQAINFAQECATKVVQKLGVCTI